MDIKLFSLCKQEVSESENGKRCIYECVSNFFDDCERFAAFSSQRRMLLAVSQSLLAADVVIIAVQSNMYHATKKMLCTALDIKLEQSIPISEKLIPKLEKGTINRNTYEANVMFPKDAEIFPTDNGINCGFAITSGGQHIIYMPIENPKAEEVVFGSLYDYIAELSEDGVTDSAMEFRHREIIERTAGKFNDNMVKVAFGSENYKDFIKSRISGHKLNAGFVTDDETGEPYDEDVNAFYIDTARMLREKHFAQYGVFFSDIISDENEGRYITAVIADESGTDTVRIYAEDGEADDELFGAAVDKIMLMLYDYNELVNASDESIISDVADRKLRNSIAKLIAAVVGASAIIGLITSVIS